MRTEELRKRLSEDVGEDEATRLLPALKRLEQWQTPVPDERDTARLLETLQATILIENQRFMLHNSPSSFRLHPSALLLRSQLRVVRYEIWAASTLVMVLGAAVTLATFGPGASIESLPFVFIAPIVAAIGVTFLYGPANDPSLEVELATPVSPRTILLARLVLLFGLNLGLGVFASVALTVLIPGLSLWLLVAAWLAPMAFLSAFTFLLSVVFVDSLVSVFVGLSLWMMQGIKQVVSIEGVFVLAYWPNLLSAEARPLLWLTTAILGGLAIWIGGREERWLSTMK
jgi:hypothetical protein